jgi:hypothetical protein
VLLENALIVNLGADALKTKGPETGAFCRKFAVSSLNPARRHKPWRLSREAYSVSERSGCPGRGKKTRQNKAIAFSSEVETGSREENAPKQS